MLSVFCHLLNSVCKHGDVTQEVCKQLKVNNNDHHHHHQQGKLFFTITIDYLLNHLTL